MLTKLVRQENDQDFQDIIESLRWGMCSPATLKTLVAIANKQKGFCA
jgi:hypothetical protein